MAMRKALYFQYAREAHPVPSQTIRNVQRQILADSVLREMNSLMNHRNNRTGMTSPRALSVIFSGTHGRKLPAYGPANNAFQQSRVLSSAVIPV